MSDWYPYEEETRTSHIRWYSEVDEFGLELVPRLQQKYVIRKGFGNEAKLTNEWRYVETVTDIPVK